MPTSRPMSFPGETADPASLLILAHEYTTGAMSVLGTARRGFPASYAPFRLLSIHAIELYLNAALLASGRPHAAVRGLHHDLNERAEIARSTGLALRKRTREHLRTLSLTREYLATRYDPNCSGMSELNRLCATMQELATKVSCLVEGQGKPSRLDRAA